METSNQNQNFYVEFVANIAPPIDASPQPDNILQDTVRMQGEAGSINMGELLDSSKTYLSIAYNGLMRRVAEVRGEDAEARERKHRQTALAVVLGHPATAAEVDGSAPRAKTWAERFMDKRVDEKSFNQLKNRARRKQTIKAYGGERSDTMTPKSRLTTWARIDSAKERYRRGELTAEELRRQEWKIRGKPKAFENPEQRRTRRVVESGAKSVNRSATQPIMSRWRDMRLGRAQEAILRHGTQEATYSDKIDAARSHLNELRRLKQQRRNDRAGRQAQNR